MQHAIGMTSIEALRLEAGFEHVDALELGGAAALRGAGPGLFDHDVMDVDPNDPAGKDDVTTINQLRLEVNRPVTVRLSSKDVIHSFGLPVMRVKQDAIPGMEIPVHFTPVKTNGEEKWEIACAQLCGITHYDMEGYYQIMTQAEFGEAKRLRDLPAVTVVHSAERFYSALAVPTVMSDGVLQVAEGCEREHRVP